jgi:hypothetical protein
MMGFFDRDTVAKASKRNRSRIEAIVIADGLLLYKFILNVFICNFYFILQKSDDFQLCCDISNKYL